MLPRRARVRKWQPLWQEVEEVIRVLGIDVIVAADGLSLDFEDITVSCGT